MSFIAVPLTGGSLQVRPTHLATTTPFLKLSIGLLATAETGQEKGGDQNL